MKAHAKTHTDQHIQCPKCPITLKTISEYNQYNKGHHSGGYVVSGGIKKQWPREVSTHKKKCADCKEILLKKRKKDLAFAVKLSKLKK